MLRDFRDGVDYCDLLLDKWIWSVAIRLADGVILASTRGDLYGKHGYRCLWLR